MNKPEIILLGAGGHCRSCIDVIEQQGCFSIAGIVGRPDANTDDAILGYPILGTDDDLPELRQRYKHAIITVGQIKSAAVRVRLYQKLVELGFELPVIVSPLAHVSPHAQAGAGTVVMHQVIVNAGAGVGVNCILNTSCLVEHDAIVGDHTHISTAAVVNGSVRVGARSFVGSNATTVHGLELPDDYFVRAGQLVISPRDGVSTASPEN
ncbi:MAG: NeuD/PglB/VioB family sugar acetyltransferase [Phycisphaerae bacterium]|nr:NeuD/PglB/VioB family sugar acetyltransferase [Phycisphaerae bacterium]